MIAVNKHRASSTALNLVCHAGSQVSGSRNPRASSHVHVSHCTTASSICPAGQLVTSEDNKVLTRRSRRQGCRFALRVRGQSSTFGYQGNPYGERHLKQCGKAPDDSPNARRGRYDTYDGVHIESEAATKPNESNFTPTGNTVP